MKASNPILFAASLIILGIVMFAIPEAVVAPLALILILGAFLVANRDAANRGVKGPLEEMGL